MSEPGPYDLRYDPNALKELRKLDRLVARRIARALERLRGDPRPQSARPLAGYPGLWRVRVGDYRAIYTIRDSELVIIALRIAHRSSVYRDL